MLFSDYTLAVRLTSFQGAASRVLGEGVMGEQGQQEQGGEADDEMSPGVLTANENFYDTSFHASFLLLRFRLGGA
jgi:hypothetical protein